MKLLFLYPYASLSPNSVQQKVSNQIHYLNTPTSSCRGIFITTQDIKEPAYSSEIEFVKIDLIKWKYFQSIQLKIKFTKCMIKIMEKEKNNFDYFLMRYPRADYWLFQFLKNFKNRVVIEHLEDEIAEIKLYKAANKFQLKIASFLSYFEHLWYPLLNERLFQKAINRAAKNLIYNSQEIAERQVSKADMKKVIIGGDAVEVKNLRLKKLAALANHINLVFLKGSSTSAEFNGLDRLIKSILAYNGKYKLNLYVLGKILTNEASLIPPGNDSIILMSTKRGPELDSFLDEMHVGVSTLALFRKKLQETTTIKTREYFARGLPFIYAYQDTDMERFPQTKEYALKFSNDESELNLDALIDFVEKIYSNPNHAQEMRKLAERFLTYDVKMRRLIDLLSSTN